MARSAHCEIKNNYGHLCGDPAVFAAYWTSTGSDAVNSCAQHLAKAIRQLQARTNGGHESTFKVWMIR